VTTDDLLRTIHERHGDYLAEVSVEEWEGNLNVNVALSTLPSEDALGVISFNGPTLETALTNAVRYLEEQTPA
jgi:hypothetical protein